MYEVSAVTENSIVGVGTDGLIVRSMGMKASQESDRLTPPRRACIDLNNAIAVMMMEQQFITTAWCGACGHANLIRSHGGLDGKPDGSVCCGLVHRDEMGWHIVVYDDGKYIENFQGIHGFASDDVCVGNYGGGALGWAMGDHWDPKISVQSMALGQMM